MDDGVSPPPGQSQMMSVHSVRSLEQYKHPATESFTTTVKPVIVIIVLLTLQSLMITDSQAASRYERIDLYDPVSSRYLGREETWFDHEGRRLRQVNTSAEEVITLLFFLQHNARGLESSGIYFEEGSDTPWRESFEWSADARQKTTTYFEADGTTADRVVIALDGQLRELSKQYFRADGTQYGRETILWNGNEDGSKAGWDFEYTGRDGGASFRYDYGDLKPAGEPWQQRIRSRNDSSERIEVRTIITDSDSSRLVTPVRFGSGAISTGESETFTLILG